MRIWIWVCFALLAGRAGAQAVTTDSALVSPLSAKTQRDLSRLNRQAADMTHAVQQSSLRVLSKMQRQESRLQQTLQQRDSSLSGTSHAVLREYDHWRQQLVSPNAGLSSARQYIPRLDSLQTALRFISTGADASALSTAELTRLQDLNTNLSALSGQLQRADDLANFLRQRQASLQQQFTSLGLVNRLTTFKQQLYYYKATLLQYKTALDDPSALSNRIMALVSSRPAFQRFFSTHSYLSTLFRIPGSDSVASGKGAPGLQTRSATNAALQAKFGKTMTIARAFAGLTTTEDQNGNQGGANPSGLSNAHEQMNGWKQKILGAGSSSSAADLPDFQPNPQHTKSFLRRLQFGFDLQTQNSTAYVPALSTIGLSVGYKLNDRSVVGIGAGYLLGWGHPFNDIAFSGQGASLRSFLNWKIKGSWWVSAGYELNYLNAINALRDFSRLRDVSAWQPSALAGIMRQYKAGSRTGTIQLLFDALYKTHIPQSQPLVFRVGYALN